jgi:hypothetical protein
MNGAHLILTGNDNDYSVTRQAGSNTQFHVYVDFQEASSATWTGRPC